MTSAPGPDLSPPPLPEEAAAAWSAARRPPVAPDFAPDEPLSARALSKLKWRCRRGLLENDLFIARFFERHEAGLTCGQAQALETLMDLSDNDLLDLLLGKKEPEPAVLELVRQMRTDGAQSLSS